MSTLEKFDAAQKRYMTTSVGWATLKKFKDDNSTNLASMIAFWAFFSIFPLFLVLVTILGYVLPASDKAKVLSHVASMFPLIGTSSMKSLSGTWWPLLLGVLTALWSGLGGVRTVQTAFNSVWEVPRHERPGLKEQVLRSLWVLVTVGVGLVLTTLISGFVTSNSTGVNLGAGGRIAGYVISIVADVGLFVAAFRMLTDREVTTRDVLPGAIFSGVIFFILQELSSFIISRHLKSAQGTYGNFATVITILWWFYLQAIVTLLGAQLDVVLRERLYPRSLVKEPQTAADHRALQAYAEERAIHPQEQVQTRVPDDPNPPADAPREREIGRIGAMGMDSPALDDGSRGPAVGDEPRRWDGRERRRGERRGSGQRASRPQSTGARRSS